MLTISLIKKYKMLRISLRHKKMYLEVLKMNFKSKSFIALSSAVCLTVVLSTGCNTAGRTPNQAGGTTQIGQNLGATTGQNNLNMNTGNRGGMAGLLGGNNNQGGNTSPGGINNLGGTNNQGGANNQGGTQLNQRVNIPAGFDTQRATNIKKHLSNMSGMQNSNVIVNGTTALVGYKTANTRNTTPDTISHSVRQFDTTITKVIATDTPNMMTEINKLASAITNNSQAQGLGDRFNNLVQRVMPNANNNNTSK
jgi:hypothetical protein